MTGRLLGAWHAQQPNVLNAGDKTLFADLVVSGSGTKRWKSAHGSITQTIIQGENEHWGEIDESSRRARESHQWQQLP